VSDLWIVKDTIPGYGIRMKHANHQDQLARLKKAQGQVAGIVRMVENERYCVDILTQLRAARAALRRVEQNVLNEHIKHCVGGAAKNADRKDADEKIDELLKVLAQFTT